MRHFNFNNYKSPNSFFKTKRYAQCIQNNQTGINLCIWVCGHMPVTPKFLPFFPTLEKVYRSEDEVFYLQAFSLLKGRGRGSTPCSAAGWGISLGHKTMLGQIQFPSSRLKNRMPFSVSLWEELLRSCAAFSVSCQSQSWAFSPLMSIRPKAPQFLTISLPVVSPFVSTIKAEEVPSETSVFN